MHCTNFEKNAGTHLHDTHRAVEEPSTASMADIGNSLSVPRANAYHMAKQSHQIRNLNGFERIGRLSDLRDGFAPDIGFRFFSSRATTIVGSCMSVSGP